MKRSICALLFFVAVPLFAQQPPEIRFHSVPDLLKLPPDVYLGEATGVAVNSKGHIFVFSRGNTTGPAYAAAAAQLLEFAPDGKFLREIGHHLYAWSFAHTVKVDKDDNIWVTDKGSDMVIKFNPEGRVVMVFGRKQEASDEGTEPLKHVKPPLPPVDGLFRQVTDVAWDSAGNTFISDGYVNSRIAKIDKDGNWLKSWGEPGDQPGQFNTPHSIAVDAHDNIYVADRGNRRIQVFDTDGKFVRQFTIDVPVDPNARPHHRYHGARRSLGHLHYAWAKSSALQLRRFPRPHLQTVSRRKSSRCLRQIRQATRPIRLGSRNRLPLRKRPLRRRSFE